MPGAETGEKADDQVGEHGGAAAHGGQRLRPHTAAHHNGVHRVVQLLKQHAEENGKEEAEELAHDAPLRQIGSVVHEKENPCLSKAKAL